MKSQKLKTLITDLTRFAFQQVIKTPPYWSKIKEASFELSDLMKDNKFKKAFVSELYNQLIRAKYEHYVVVLGSDYMLQVKYSKGSMIKFEILGQLVLLYEVPYLAVPTIKDAERLTDQEYEQIEDREKKEQDVRVTVKQQDIRVPVFEGFEQMLEKSLKESLVWYVENVERKKKQI